VKTKITTRQTMRANSLSFVISISLYFLSLGSYHSQGVQILKQLDEDVAPYGYAEYLPVGYDTNTNDSFPLIIFLTGSGETGNGTTQLSRVTNVGLAKNIKNGYDLPAIVLTPQTIPDEWYNPGTLDKFLDSVLQIYRIDPSKVYMTGLSLGGASTWWYASTFPDRLAAAVPIAGATRPEAGQGENLVDLSIWAFHNSGDQLVLASNTTKWRDSILVAGGMLSETLKFTFYNQNGHGGWNETYAANSPMWAWLFDQENKKAEISLEHFDTGNNLIVKDISSTTEINVKVNSPNGISSVKIDLSALGLGSSITMQDNGGGNFSASVTASTAVEMAYYPLLVVVEDGIGNERVFERTIPVVDQLKNSGEVYFEMLLNFNSGSNQAHPWNNFDEKPRVPWTFFNLIETGASTSQYEVHMERRWIGANQGGATTGNNSGPFPDNTMRALWSFGPADARLVLKNLDSKFNYKLTFFNSRTQGGNRNNTYTINGQSITVNAANNTSEVAIFENLTPDTDGSLLINIDPQLSQGYLNVMKLEATSKSAPVPCTGIVTSSQHGDPGSLSYEIACAQAGDLLNFGAAVNNTDINIPNAIEVDKNIVIRNELSGDVSLIQSPTNALFNIAEGRTLTIDNVDLTITDSDFVQNQGILILKNLNLSLQNLNILNTSGHLIIADSVSITVLE